MDIDPTQPWGLAIDYAGRATLTESGHTIHVNVSDTSLSSIVGPDSISGTYSPVNVTAQFTETGEGGAVLRGTGRVTIMPVGTDPVVPDPTAVQRAVAEALTDFATDAAAYVALCAQWQPDDDAEDGDGTTPGPGTAPDPNTGADPETAADTAAETGTATEADAGTSTSTSTSTDGDPAMV
ncbi:ATP-binding protein [Streptomyces sp. NBC_01334]|uniref:ATP-binding protein n=1 Tax=Streptomyces sp. NBC_01334 TaxID=2903827 RepID=UPI002E10D4BF|nr:ATP-binding protein [Streptomyces sp. NBC_01334]